MKNYFDKIKGRCNEIFRKINIIKIPKKASSILMILIIPTDSLTELHLQFDKQKERCFY